MSKAGKVLKRNIVATGVYDNNKQTYKSNVALSCFDAHTRGINLKSLVNLVLVREFNPALK